MFFDGDGARVEGIGGKGKERRGGKRHDAPRSDTKFAGRRVSESRRESDTAGLLLWYTSLPGTKLRLGLAGGGSSTTRARDRRAPRVRPRGKPT